MRLFISSKRAIESYREHLKWTFQKLKSLVTDAGRGAVPQWSTYFPEVDKWVTQARKTEHASEREYSCFQEESHHVCRPHGAGTQRTESFWLPIAPVLFLSFLCSHHTYPTPLVITHSPWVVVSFSFKFSPRLLYTEHKLITILVGILGSAA